MSLPQILTYFAYIFIVAFYTYKVRKVVKLPLHLRWELYPVPFGKGHEYGGSYLEEKEWWNKTLPKAGFGGFFHMLKKYLFFGGYFKLKRSYWLWMYPWHIGFYLIILFHVLTFFSALIMVVTGLTIAANAPNVFGVFMYYLVLVVSLSSFILGTIGSLGLLIKRTVNEELRSYATASNYFNYIFFLIVFVSGLFAWQADPSLSGYREYWKSLITFKYMTLEPATFIHVMLFNIFLIYLPFTRSTHYLTKIIAFFGILWNDKPNLAGGEMDKEISVQLGKTVTWSAAHIQTGKTWGEVATQLPESVTGKVNK
jgi:nitrate reductase gamma subunit